MLLLLVREGVQAAQGLQSVVASGRFEWASRIWMWLAARFGVSNADLSTLVEESTRRVGAFLAGATGGILTNVVVTIFELFVTLFALFYFLCDGDAILNVVRRLLPFEEKLREQMLTEAGHLIHASVRVSLVIAVLQGSLCGLAFFLAGIGAPAFWGVVMAFLSLLPVVGSWPIWVPAAVWLFANGNVGRGILLVVICGGIAGTIDNILRPILLSGGARMSGLLVFVSVLGGVSAFGMIGIILGPIVFATAMSVLDVYVRGDRPA
jgi:predicted PurR-regulated permease PerM